MLRGSSCSEYSGSTFRCHGYQTLPAYRVDLTYRVIPVEQDKSIPLPGSRGKYIARWTDGGADNSQGESEGCCVMEQIPVASVASTTSPDAKAGPFP
jgi:hypothetical protein